MSKSTLLHVNAGGGEAGGFDQAYTFAKNGRAAFEEPVWQAIQRGGIWSGTGQPDAAAVLGTNAVAFNIAEVMMEAASAAMKSATLGFSALQKNLADLNDYAKALGCWVHENGTVTWDDANPHRPSDPIGPDKEFRRINTETAVLQTLKLATALDGSTKASLQSVYQNAPDVAYTRAQADRSLPRNKQIFVDAVDSRNLIVEVAAGWYILDENSVLGVDDVRKAGGQPFPESATKHLQELDLLIDAIGVTRAGPVLNLLKQDFPAILLDALTLGATLGGKKAAEVGEAVAARVLGLAPKVIAAYGYLELAKEVAAYLFEKLSPDGEPTDYVVVSGGVDGEVKARVGDADLAGIASAYYSPTGNGNDAAESVADLAHLQRVNGQTEGTEDFVAQAKDVRADLQQWLADHPDLPADDPDRQYAEGLVAELDESIGYLA